MFSKIVWLSNDFSVMLLTLSQILLYFSYFIYFFIKFYQILLLNSLFLISEVMYVVSLKLLICPFISGSFIYNGLIFLSSLCQLSINLSMSTLSMSIGFLEGDQWVFFYSPNVFVRASIFLSIKVIIFNVLGHFISHYYFFAVSHMCFM